MSGTILSIMSGKGGVGKTSFVSNLAQSSASEGKSVLIFDNDTSLANIDIAFGVKPKFTLADFANNQCTIQQLITKVDKNVYIIPAYSGLSAINTLSEKERTGIRDVINQMKEYFDLVLIDNPAGISKEVFDFIPLSSKMIIIINNDILSLTDSFALMKTLSNNNITNEFSVICNRMNKSESQSAFIRLQKTSAVYLKTARLNLLGNVEFNLDFTKALNNQTPLTKTDKKLNTNFINLSHKITNEATQSYRNIYG